MTIENEWLDYIDSTLAGYDGSLITKSELTEILSAIISHPESPIEGLTFEIRCAPPFQLVNAGKPGTGEATDTQTVDLQHRHSPQARVSFWRKPNGAHRRPTIDSMKLSERLVKLIRSFWRPDLRDDPSGLLSLQYPSTADSADRFLGRRGAGERVAILFCDLDHFKAVNDHLGESAGDRVILELGSLLAEVMQPDGIGLHRSGDEFTAMLPIRGADQALRRARLLMDTVQAHDFNIGNLKVAISCGIAILDPNERDIRYRALEARAEMAVKPGGGIKHRGKTTLESHGGDTDLVNATGCLRDLALCVIKSGAPNERPFTNPWLNFLSQLVFESIEGTSGDLSRIPAVFEKYVQWCGPDLRPNTHCLNYAADSEIYTSRAFSAFDLLLSVAHGAYRSAWNGKFQTGTTERLVLVFDQDTGCRLEAQSSGAVVASTSEPSTPACSFDLGGFDAFAPDGEEVRTSISKAILVKIGHSQLQMPISLFAQVIIVDDRPTRGGALPDFWEATIARLVTNILSNPNISAVYCFGNQANALLTVEKLSNLDAWHQQLAQMAYKTGLSQQDIREGAQRLSKSVSFPADLDDLTRQLAGVFRTPSIYRRTEARGLAPWESRFLSRELRVTGMTLGREDGCQVDTVAKAYPVVLEIVRTAGNQATVIDHAGQELRELLDFKILIKNPGQDLIPWFYRDDQERFAKYFEQTFSAETSLFGSIFRQTGQLDVVVKHVIESLGGSDRQSTTRRAILVVPNDVKSRDELAPLGLVAIRIIPRFAGSSPLLHYSYTWRSVEAVVGFPYSLYASVRFSRLLTDQISDGLKVSYGQSIAPQLGFVSYIALSLHMFMDGYGQDIARRIVNDASV
jgi:diguanylate cyclase (GGDEF)-like protein